MAITQPTSPTTNSAFWASAGIGDTPTAYNLKNFRSYSERQMAQAVGRHGFRKYRAIYRALNGNAVGGVAVYTTWGRVQAGQTMNDAAGGGGRRTIEVLSGNITTTSAMRDAINAKVYDNIFGKAPNQYPTDRSGNGGGGKLNR
jgi:hypothetical protein